MIEPCLSHVGLVAIGRNEGERLRACLASVVGLVSHIVYVDSGSTDGSVAMAQAMGVHVVNLDMTVPFTAARARNEGWRALLALKPDLAFIQFVDGDCVVDDGWLESAQAFLQHHTSHAAVCGRRREKYPEQSIFNRLCDLEWDTPVGDVKSCGGDAMMRVVSLTDAGGFRDDLIAGEEPELCIRLRAMGWLIRRLDEEMTLHDAAIFQLSQWWKRSTRAGYAYANRADLHKAAGWREVRRALGWGLVLPFFVFACSFWSVWLGACLLLAYPAQFLRVAWRERYRGAVAVPLSFFWLLGRLPEATGVVRYFRHRIAKTQGRIIEYK